MIQPENTPKSPPRPFLSLPARIALAVAAVLIATTVVADLMAMRELRRRLADSVFRSLSGMVGRMGEQVDDELAALSELVRGEADLVEGLDAGEAAAVLRGRAAELGFAFDYGVILVDGTGAVLADSLGRDWSGKSLAEEEFFQRTFVGRRGVVSEPFRSPLADATPVAMVTAAILDENRRTRAVLAGGLDLLRNRTVNRPADLRTSRHGQFGIFTGDGTVVAHSDKEMLLNRYENPLPDGALAGLEKGGEAVTVRTATADGHPALLAVSALRHGSWVLAGVFSQDEVFAPIEDGFAAAHRWFAAGLAASCVLLWLIARWGVRDLDLLAGEVEGIGEAFRDDGGTRVGTAYRGEAGKMAGAVNGMLESLAAARRDIDGLSTRLAEAGERERREIAADLHDSVCQSLALANMRLGSVGKRLGGGKEAEEVAGVRGILEEAVGELRSLTFSLSPGIVYELGPGAALEWFGGEIGEKHGLGVEVRTEGEFGGMDEGEAMFFYRAGRELLVNAAKHSGAGKVWVRLRREGEEASLEVGDDGKGFADGPGDGFGLRHLRERARQFGGTLAVGRRDGGGALATLRAPFHERRS